MRPDRARHSGCTTTVSLCLDQLIGFAFTILSGVVVNLVTLWLASR